MLTSKGAAAAKLQEHVGSQSPSVVMLARRAFDGISPLPDVRPDFRLQAYSFAALNSSIALCSSLADAPPEIKQQFKSIIRPSVLSTVELLRAAADLLEETIS